MEQGFSLWKNESPLSGKNTRKEKEGHSLEAETYLSLLVPCFNLDEYGYKS